MDKATPITSRFGKKVRTIRLRGGFSQGDVARKLKLHRSYISGIERGIRNPSLMVIQKIANALHVRAKDLIP